MNGPLRWLYLLGDGALCVLLVHGGWKECKDVLGLFIEFVGGY
jgi:hypothetical protein